MRSLLQKPLVALALLAAPTYAACSAAQPGPQQDQGAAPEAADMQAMAEMMAAAKKYTTPGPEHEVLGLLVGEWDVEASMPFMGPDAPKSKGKSVTSWKLDGRVIESEWTGNLMGMDGTNVQLLGYDRFKQSFVMTMFASFDTAMNRAEGDLTRDGKTLILYGTLDEYLTGEHDKMVKYVYRFSGSENDAGALTSIDKIKLEVHDLPIGETGTMVLQFDYTRTK